MFIILRTVDKGHGGSKYPCGRGRGVPSLNRSMLVWEGSQVNKFEQVPSGRGSGGSCD